MKKIFFALLLFELSGCAVLHYHQIGEIDSDVVKKGRRFEILLSETGFNIKEAGGIARAATTHEGTRDQIKAVQDIISLFQMGPRTGNQVFTDQFADNLADKILEKCPKGKVSGLSSTRESAKYPVVSGEIVKIIGYCYDKVGA